MYSALSIVTLLAAAVPAFAAPTSLQERGFYCKGAAQCANVWRPANTVATCMNNACGSTCADGYTLKSGRCLATPSTTFYLAPATTASSTSAAATATSSLIANAVASSSVTGFAGNNTNAILSWFHTNLSTDSTNGHSWCGFPYSDAVPGFAPSLKTMLNNFDGDYETAARAYCGLEAVIITPDGRNATLYIADAFDDTWVRTPASLDIVYGSFPLLFGKSTDNKNDVVKNAAWTLTGNRDPRWAFKSTTSLTGLSA
ncbi:hypothetical protein JCM8547_003640 [Rhodosporidiobolus lusitaniae]